MALSQSRALAVLMPELVARLGVQVSDISVILSAEVAAFCVTTQLSASLLNKMSARTIIFAANVVNVACSLVFSQFQTYPIYFLCHIVKVATHGCMINNVLVLISYYFKQHRGVATTLVLIGSPIATMLVPPLTRYLRDEFGFEGFYLLIGGLEFQGFVAIMLLRPKQGQGKVDHSQQQVKVDSEVCSQDQSTERSKQTETPLSSADNTGHGERTSTRDKPSDKKNEQNFNFIKLINFLFDLTLVKDPKVIVMITGLSILSASMALEVYLPSFAEEVGISPRDTPSLLTIFGAVSVPARFIFSYLADRKVARASVLAVLAAIISAVSLAFSPLYTSYSHFVVLAVITGLFKSQFINLISLICLEIVPLNKLAKLFALKTIVECVIMINANLIYGVVIDVSGTFSNVFLLMSGCFTIGAALISVNPMYSWCVARKKVSPLDGVQVNKDSYMTKF